MERTVASDFQFNNLNPSLTIDRENLLKLNYPENVRPDAAVKQSLLKIQKPEDAILRSLNEQVRNEDELNKQTIEQFEKFENQIYRPSRYSSQILREQNKNKEELGLPDVEKTSVKKVDPELSKRVKDAYDALPVDDSSNPEVKAAYEKAAKEIDKQFEYLTKDLGIEVEFIKDDPYKNSDEMFEDIINKQSFIK
jgi:hypothetical protein